MLNDASRMAAVLAGVGVLGLSVAAAQPPAAPRVPTQPGQTESTVPPAQSEASPFTPADGTAPATPTTPQQTEPAAPPAQSEASPFTPADGTAPATPAAPPAATVEEPPSDRPDQAPAPAPPRRPMARPRPYEQPPGPEFERPTVPLAAVVRDPVSVFAARRRLLAGHYAATKAALDVLAIRYPADPRVPYLRYYLQFRTGQSCGAIASLQRAVALDYYDPLDDYWEFMAEIQGPARIYAERVRRSVDDLAEVGALKIPSREELLAPREDPNADQPAPAPE